MATPVQNQAQKQAANSVKHIRDDVEGAVNHVRHAAEEAGANVREYLHEKGEQADELRKTAEASISNHPMRSVALAALGGLVLGALLRR